MTTQSGSSNIAIPMLIATLALSTLSTLAACGATTDPERVDAEADADITQEDGQTQTGATTTQIGSETGADTELFPDVIAAEAALDDNRSWTFTVTISSPYDSPQRYADAWRVVGPDGTVFGERILAHDHGGEQPFSRSKSGIEIPDDVTEVTVEGRDQLSGWGGDTVIVSLDRG